MARIRRWIRDRENALESMTLTLVMERLAKQEEDPFNESEVHALHRRFNELEDEISIWREKFLKPAPPLPPFEADTPW